MIRLLAVLWKGYGVRLAGGSTTASNCSKPGNSPAAVLCDSGSCRGIGRGEELEGLHGNEAKPLRWLARAGAQQGGTATAEQRGVAERGL